MTSVVPRSKSDDETPAISPDKKRRGVTVVTEYGTAVSFGVSKDRTERLLKTMGLRKYREVTAAMQEQKAARLRGSK